MNLGSEIDRDSILERFRSAKFDQHGNSLYRFLSYGMDLVVSPSAKEPLESLERITVIRTWLHPTKEPVGHIWPRRGSRGPVPLSPRHFLPCTFRYPDQDSAFGLLILSLLALKLIRDCELRLPNPGLLFRSEIYALRELGRWPASEIDFDKYISDIRAYTTTGATKHRSRRRNALRDFLVADDELFNLVSWAGTGKFTRGEPSTEKVWVLNAEPSRIRIWDTRGSELLGPALSLAIERLLPSNALLTPEQIDTYDSLLDRGDSVTFSPSEVRARAIACDSITRPVDRTSTSANSKPEQTLATPVFPSVPPSRLISFEELLLMHRSSKFFGRDEVFRELDSLLSRPANGAPFVLLVGEPGIGKTACIAEFILRRGAHDVHYFFKDSNPFLRDPYVFLSHLNSALSRKYNVSCETTSSSTCNDLIYLLNGLMQSVNARLTPTDSREILVLDALDESLRSPAQSYSVPEVLCSLTFPSCFRVLLSSRQIPDLKRFRNRDGDNCVSLTAKHAENLRDVESLLRHRQQELAISSLELQRLVISSQGNFLYASLLVKMLESRELPVEDILRNPPQGLEALYDLKLTLFRSQLESTPHAPAILKVLRALSLTLELHTIRELCEILQLDYFFASEIFGPIEQFFDLSIYDNGNGVCGFFHRSFEDYMRDRSQLPHAEQCDIYEAIVEHVINLTQEGRWSELNEYFVHCSIAYFQRVTLYTMRPRHFLDRMQLSFLPSYLESPFFNTIEFWNLCLMNFGLAKRAKSGRDILRFGMMVEAQNYWTQKPMWMNRPAGPWPTARFPGNHNGPFDVQKAIQHYSQNEADESEVEALVFEACPGIREAALSADQLFAACMEFANLSQ